jgi:hypothetical protein
VILCNVRVLVGVSRVDLMLSLNLSSLDLSMSGCEGGFGWVGSFPVMRRS